MENVVASAPTVNPLGLESQPDHTQNMDGMVLECYDNRIPAFIEPHLRRLYRSIFSSLLQFRIHGGAEQASVCLARNGDDVTSVLLYRRNGRTVTVINQCIRLDDPELVRFCRCIFNRFHDVDLILFHVLEQQARLLPFPYYSCACREDFILHLPASIEEYHSSLGKSTRSYINRYLNKLKRSFPSFCFEVYSGGHIRQQDLHHIFELNRSRMDKRGIAYGFSEDYPLRTFELLQQAGFLAIVRIDGQICAGTIIYQAEDEYYLDVLSHKSEYNDYGLGTLCCYLSICECIRRGGRVFHFLWGRYDYKTRLGGKLRILSDFAVFRSPLALLRHAATVGKLMMEGCSYRAKAWLHDPANKDKPLTRTIGKLLNLVRFVQNRQS